MPISSKFDYTRQLRVITKELHNQAIDTFFKALKGKDGKPIKVDDDSVSTSLASLKTTCKINSDDSLVIQQSKMQLFELLKAQLAPSSATEALYAVPIGTFKETVKYVPQINIQLQETYASAQKEKRQQLSMSISFRLAGKTSESLNEIDLIQYANRIENRFTIGDEPKEYRKGATKYNYRDEQNGYRLSFLVPDESNGRNLLEDVLYIQGHDFYSDYVSISESKKQSNQSPGNKFVLGDFRRLPTYRGVGDVLFKRATIDIWEMPKPIILCEVKRGKIITFSGF